LLMYLDYYFNILWSFFLMVVVLEFELRASCLQAQHSTI
jgi:hypothetical protein